MTALGNQLTKLKINQIDLLESLPFEEPKKTPADEIDVIGEELIDKSKLANSNLEPKIENPTTQEVPKENTDIDPDDEVQTTLF